MDVSRSKATRSVEALRRRRQELAEEERLLLVDALREIGLLVHATETLPGGRWSLVISLDETFHEPVPDAPADARLSAPERSSDQPDTPPDEPQHAQAQGPIVSAPEQEHAESSVASDAHQPQDDEDLAFDLPPLPSLPDLQADGREDPSPVVPERVSLGQAGPSDLQISISAPPVLDEERPRSDRTLDPSPELPPEPGEEDPGERPSLRLPDLPALPPLQDFGDLEGLPEAELPEPVSLSPLPAHPDPDPPADLGLPALPALALAADDDASTHEAMLETEEWVRGSDDDLLAPPPEGSEKILGDDRFEPIVGDEPEDLATILAHLNDKLRCPPRTKQPNPFLANTGNPALRAERYARTLVSDIIAYRAQEHRTALERGPEAIRTAFLDEIEHARTEFFAFIGDDSADMATVFRDATNDVLGNGQEIIAA